MLIFSGVIGLLQCVLLPGLILSKVFKIRGGLIERFLYLFPLSLVANYLVIFLLAALRIYTRPVLSLLIAFEIFALLFLFRQAFRTPLKEILLKAEKTIKQELQPLTTAFSQPFHNSEEIIQNALWVLSGLGSVSAESLYGKRKMCTFKMQQRLLHPILPIYSQSIILYN